MSLQLESYQIPENPKRILNFVIISEVNFLGLGKQIYKDILTSNPEVFPIIQH